jgi:hypothetical protein
LLPTSTQDQAVMTLVWLLASVALATLGVGAITTIACAATRESERTHEFAIRRAVGASVRLLRRAAFVEGLLLAAVAVAIGGATGVLLHRAALATWPGIVQSGSPVAATIAALAIAVLLLGGLLYPVVVPRRRVTEVEPRETPLVPVALQLGLSLIALTTSALLVRHAAELAPVPTLRAADGRVFPVSLNSMPPSERAARYARLLKALEHDPRIEGASLANPGALLGLGPVTLATTDCGRCSEANMWLPWRIRSVTHQLVSADTFRLLGIDILEGRGIQPTDTWDAPRIAVVNRSLATHEFQDGNAIGRRIQVGDDDSDWSLVVGVVDDHAPTGLGGPTQPRYTVYVSSLQHPPAAAELLVRDSGESDIVPVVQQALDRAVGTRNVDGPVRRESEVLAADTAPMRWFGRWFTFEGWAMFAIAVAGALGLLRLWGRSLYLNLGIRRAVGARRGQMLSRVLGRAGLVGASSVGLGLWFGPHIWSVLPSMIAGQQVWDTGIVIRYGLLLIGVVLVGAALPAWRAARLTPMALIDSRGT